MGGGPWKEASGEVHAHYLEIAVWILLHDDYDIAAVDEQVWAVFATFTDACGPLTPEVGFFVKAGNQVGLFATSSASLGKIILSAVAWRPKGGLFRAEDSRRANRQ